MRTVSLPALLPLFAPAWAPSARSLQRADAPKAAIATEQIRLSFSWSLRFT